MPDLAYLSVRAVSRSFGDVCAVRDMSFDVPQGAFLAILGPSGCGKSTLFNIMAGLLAPDRGDVLLDGTSVLCRPGCVGYMLQHDLLLPWRTIADNVALAPMLRGEKKPDVRALAQPLLASAGLSAFADHLPGQLSGGMRQRAALLRTLMTGKEILLLDEPFGALDAITRLQLQMMLLDMWQKHRKTILFVTHDVEEAVLLADEVLVLSARPGSVRERVAVPLPRPRSPEMLIRPEIGRLRLHLTELLNQEVTDHGED